MGEFRFKDTATLLRAIKNEVYLLFIYDKSDFENINDSDILELIEAASIL